MRRSALRSLIFIKSAKLENSISPRPVKFAEIVKIFQMRFHPCEIDFAMREKKGRNARVVFLFARVGDWARLGGVDSRLLAMSFWFLPPSVGRMLGSKERL